MTMKKKYLFLMRTAEIGGAERRLMDYFNYINYDNYDVTWAVRKDAFSRYLKEKSLPVKIVQLPLSWDKDGVIQRFLKFYQFIKQIHPDVIIYHQFWLISFSLPELIAGFLLTKGETYMFVHDCAPVKKKYKRRIHFGFVPGMGWGWFKERVFQKLLVYFSKRVITVSEAVKNLLIKFYKYPEGKIKVVYHGINVQRFCPSPENKIEFRKSFNIPDSDIVIVSTARLNKVKRLDRLIKAFGVLAKQYKNIWLILAGEGEEHNELLRMVDDLTDNIRERIKFLGFVEEVSFLLSACDIYVLPSDSEGFPRACIEAMSCGLISVVTNSGGQVEIIKDGINGFLIHNNFRGVLQGLEKALNLNGHEVEIISRNAVRHIVENYSLPDRVQSALNFLNIDP